MVPARAIRTEGAVPVEPRREMAKEAAHSSSHGFPPNQPTTASFTQPVWITNAPRPTLPSVVRMTFLIDGRLILASLEILLDLLVIGWSLVGCLQVVGAAPEPRVGVRAETLVIPPTRSQDVGPAHRSVHLVGPPGPVRLSVRHFDGVKAKVHGPPWHRAQSSSDVTDEPLMSLASESVAEMIGRLFSIVVTPGPNVGASSPFVRVLDRVFKGVKQGWIGLV